MKAIVAKTVKGVLTLDVVTCLQAKRRLYVGVIRMATLRAIYRMEDADIAPEHRAQRTPSPARIGKLCRYLVDHLDDYILSALTLTVDGDLKNVSYVPASEDRSYGPGQLKLGPDVRILVNDGQHRVGGVLAALSHDKKTADQLANEQIPVLILFDQGLERSQQIFADLNRNAAKPPASLNLAYDHRDPDVALTRAIIQAVPIFDGRVEYERTTLGKTSPMMFSLSSLHQANRRLIGDLAGTPAQLVDMAATFWRAVTEAIPDWQGVQEGRLIPQELRPVDVHCHGMALLALAEVGRHLLVRAGVDGLTKQLAPLAEVDWSRTAEHWRHRATDGSRILKSSRNVTLTANFLMDRLGMDLPVMARAVEHSLPTGRIGNGTEAP